MARYEHVERRIAEIASRQDDVITHAQLLEAGMTNRQLDWRMRRGTLRRLHRRVDLTSYAPPSLRAGAPGSSSGLRPG